VFNDDDCFDNANCPLEATLDVNLRGNIFVEGDVRLGGASTSTAAIAKNKMLTIASSGQQRIFNGLQYEDALYVAQNTNGTPNGGYEMNDDGIFEATGVVADVFGNEISGGKTNASQDIIPIISPGSHTMLGLVSEKGILIETGSTDNFNLHASMFAGMLNPRWEEQAYYDEAYGLGVRSPPYGFGGDCAPLVGDCGFGFGYQGYALDSVTKTFRGTTKILGTLVEYQPYGIGGLAYPSSGVLPFSYRPLYTWDERLMGDIEIPGFPGSRFVTVLTTIVNPRWRFIAASEF